MDALFQFLKRLIAPVTALVTGVVGYFKGRADVENEQIKKNAETAAKQRDALANAPRDDAGIVDKLHDGKF